MDLVDATCDELFWLDVEAASDAGDHGAVVVLDGEHSPIAEDVDERSPAGPAVHARTFDRGVAETDAVEVIGERLPLMDAKLTALIAVRGKPR